MVNIKIINLFLCFSMLFVSIILFIAKLPVSALDFLLWFLISVIFSFIFDKMKLTPKYKILANIAIWLHLFGLVYAYEYSFYYDKIIHIVSAFLITLIVSDFYKKNWKVKNIYLSLFVFLSVLGILSLWEVYEYVGDVFFGYEGQGVFASSGTPLMSPLTDTFFDLIFGGLGSLAYLLFTRILKAV